MKWAKLLLYVAPVSVLVLDKCRQMGLNPLLPVAGLVIGLVIELRR